MTDCRVVRSNRKSLAIEVTRELEVVIRAPFFVSEKRIADFVTAHQSWIEKAKIRIMQKKENCPPPPTDEEIAELKTAASQYIFGRVEYFGKIMGLEPTAVKITAARTRFGSCSAKNSLCFSCFLMQKPLEAVDYVIVHELAHIRHKNHGKSFYALIEKYIPDYKDRNKLLKRK